MDRITHALLLRKELLTKAINMAKTSLLNSPDGHLRILKKNKYTQYYRISDESKPLYLPAKENSLIKQLAQKDYDKRFLAKANEELKAIEALLHKNVLMNSELVFNQLSDMRQELVDPYMMDIDSFVRNWQAAEYEPNPNHPDDKLYSTKRGELVRSKSELFFADMFFDMDIPYKYECPLRLKSGLIVYPDFTMLKKSTLEVYYHEHLGLLDNDEYRKNAFLKIEEYRKNGIYIGKNLIITQEVAGCPINTRTLKTSFAEIFLE